MDVWREAIYNWSELNAAMGCARMQISGAIISMYPIRRSGTFYNSVLVQDPDFFEIEDVEDVFAKKGLPFAIRIPQLASYARLEKSLRARGYSLLPIWSLMTQKEWVGKGNPQVEVREIDRSRLTDWFELQRVFGHAQSSRATEREMIERTVQKRSVQLLLAMHNDRPVGAGLLFLKDRVASIHMIATSPDFRRRHVATTITLEALRRAKNERVDLIWLRTRRGGVGGRVYTKIGFSTFSDILSYTKTPELEDLPHTG